MVVGPQESVLAPRFSRVMTILIGVICVLTEVSLVAYGHLDVLLRGTPAVALGAYGTYVLFWAPLVRVDPTGIAIVNPLRTVRVRWPAVQDIDTQWTLSIVTATGRIQAWASPAQSPWASLGRFRRDALGRPSLGKEQPVRAGTGPTSIQGLVTRQWESYRGGQTAVDDVRTTWHRATTVALGVLAILTIAGIAWP